MPLMSSSVVGKSFMVHSFSLFITTLKTIKVSRDNVRVRWVEKRTKATKFSSAWLSVFQTFISAF